MTARPARPADLKIGARVLYRGAWGNDPAQEGEIVGGPSFETINEDGKAFAVWDVRLDGSDTSATPKWGYLDQFSIPDAAKAKE